MTDAKYDVLGIGNAIFDVLLQTDEGFLARHGMTKGGMALTHEVRAAGVAFETKAASAGPATGCSYILVTPDGERTMNTYLGAAQDLNPSDIDAAEVAASSFVYLEGYLWDPSNAKDAFVKASTIA